MNKSFEAILTALRNHNGMAIDNHHNSEVKIEAIAKFGEVDTVAMFADVSYYSLNGMYVNDAGRAVVSTYSWAVMGPEIIQDTPALSAEEFNKPQYHTPGLSYHKLTEVTLIEEKEIEVIVNDIDHLVYALGLTPVKNNPLPQVAGENVLFASNDNHLFLAVTKMPTSDAGRKINDAYKLGIDMLMATGKFNFEYSTEPLDVVTHTAWFKKIGQNCKNVVNEVYSVFHDVFKGNPDCDALNYSFVTADGYYVTITDLLSKSTIPEEVAHRLLTGELIYSGMTQQDWEAANAVMAMSLKTAA